MPSREFGREDVKPVSARVVRVELPGDMHAFVRTITMSELDAFELAFQKANKTDFRARMIVAACCDSEGRNKFTLADLESVRSLPALIGSEISAKILEINNFTPSADSDPKKDSPENTANDSSCVS